jgi:hypothetical protein
MEAVVLEPFCMSNVFLKMSCCEAYPDPSVSKLQALCPKSGTARLW